MEVVEKNPYVDEVFPMPRFAGWIRWLTDLAFQIRTRRFDAAIVLRRRGVLPSLACKVARVPVRAGNIYRFYDRFRILTYNLDAHPAKYGWHEVTHVLHVAGQIVGRPLPSSAPTLFIDEGSESLAHRLLRDRGVSDRYIVLQPSTGGSSRAWLPERYSQFARLLHQTTQHTVVVTGTSREKSVAKKVCDLAGAGCVSLAGDTSITTLAAILRSAHLYVGGDTGTMHVAAAVRTPCVIVYPMSTYRLRLERYHPWGVEYSVVTPRQYCNGCTDMKCYRKGVDCLRSISPEQVVAESLHMLHKCVGY